MTSALFTRVRWFFAGLALVLALVPGCSEEQPAWLGDPLAEPQATSLSGEDLYAVPDTTGEIAGADAAVSEAPDDVELLLAAARVRWNFEQFRQAIAIYTRVMELAPDDWRPHAYRGIRRVSVREFDGAVTDLKRARELAPLSYRVSYNLGLAYFLEGRFDEAADEYLRCFELADDPVAEAAQAPGFRSCSQIHADVETRVSITDWTVRALVRAGRNEEAAELLDTITPDMPMPPDLNLAYFHAILFYKGLMTAEEVMSIADNGTYTLETAGYGLANWYLVEGDTARAVAILEQVAAHPRWRGFGRIAAEVELARLADSGDIARK